MFNSIADGYFGLAPFKGSMALEEAGHNNMLEQMFFHGMIKKKMFGIHTKMWGSEEDDSQIRFGGYNEDLVKESHNDMTWIDTVDKETWEIPIVGGGFHGEDVFNMNVQKAIINPGYPFIAMPEASFDQFKEDIMTLYEGEPITCDDRQWCYYTKPCTQIIDEGMPDLRIKLKTGEGKTHSYAVPPISFLYSDYDVRTNVTTCHIMIVSQHSGMDYWTLGAIFMENFYVAYDATDSQQLKVGLSLNVVPEETGHMALAVIVFMMAGLLVVIFGVLFVCICVRERRQKRLEKAKAQFGLEDEKKEGDGPVGGFKTGAAVAADDDPEKEFLD